MGPSPLDRLDRNRRFDALPHAPLGPTAPPLRHAPALFTQRALEPSHGTPAPSLHAAENRHEATPCLPVTVALPFRFRGSMTPRSGLPPASHWQPNRRRALCVARQSNFSQVPLPSCTTCARFPGPRDSSHDSAVSSVSCFCAMHYVSDAVVKPRSTRGAIRIKSPVNSAATTRFGVRFRVRDRICPRTIRRWTCCKSFSRMSLQHG